MFKIIPFVFMLTAAKLIDLNQNSYFQLLSEFEYTFIYFYSPYVVHHASINNEFKMLVHHFPKAYPSANVGFGKVQCLIEYILCSDLNLDGFPLFILYSSKELLIYKRARRFRSMMKFIASKIDNDLKIITPNSDIIDTDLVTKHDHVLIGYHLSSKNVNILQDVLHHHSYDVEFAIFHDGQHEEHTDNHQTLVFYKNGEEWLSMKGNHNTNIFSSKSINKLIEYGLLPNMEELTPQNYVKYIHSDAAIFWLWVDIDHKSVNNPIFSILHDLISYRRVTKLEPFGCVFSDSHKFKTHLHSLDLDETNSFPQALFIYDEKKYHYAHNHDNDFSFDKLLTFLESIMDTDYNEKRNRNILFGTRSLSSKYGNPMSAPIDSAQDAVYAINTEYHDHVAYNSNMAVVIQYYARWSERCKEFARDYRKIGSHFFNTTDVVIAKLNIVHNDPPFYISQLPKIVLYYKGNGKQYISYNGIMHSTLIIEWINKHKDNIQHSSKIKLQFD